MKQTQMQRSDFQTILTWVQVTVSIREDSLSLPALFQNDLSLITFLNFFH